MASTASIVLEILKALKVEFERPWSIVYCRSLQEVVPELKQQFQFTDADIARGLDFLTSRGLVITQEGGGETIALPTDEGLAYLEKAQSKEQASPPRWVLEPIYYFIILAMGLVALTMVAWMWR